MRKVGSGRLSLRLGRYYRYRTWSDRSRWTLEDKLGAAFAETHSRIDEAAAELRRKDDDLLRRQQAGDTPIKQAKATYGARGRPRRRRGLTYFLSPVSDSRLREVDDQRAENTFLTFGHVLASIGAEHDPPIMLEDIRVIRHSYNTGEEAGLRGPEDATEGRIRAYTRYQGISPRQFPAKPERYWVVLIADGQRRSRLWGTFESHGEVTSERTSDARFFDLRRNRFLEPLANRLVVEWDTPRVWHRNGSGVKNMPVLEIADRDKVPFPGFDNVLLNFEELVEMVTDRRYAEWRTALSQVQGIYLITDTSNGKNYVGKADGTERIFGRWKDYASDGHGGNRALRELAAISIGNGGKKTDHARHFLFSILRVFGPSTPSSEVDRAEQHYKNALVSRNGKWGLNRN